jgi:MFS family permease
MAATSEKPPSEPVDSDSIHDSDGVVASEKLFEGEILTGDHGAHDHGKKEEGSVSPSSETSSTTEAEEEQGGGGGDADDDENDSSQPASRATRSTIDLEVLQRSQSRISRPQSLLGETIFVAVLCSAQLMTQVGLALSVAPVHIIGRSFDGMTSPGKLSWLTAAYSLTVGTFILIAGRMGDVFGYKRFLVGGLVWNGLWFMAAGCSVYTRSGVFFSFCRAMQGIGPAFMLPNAVAIIGRAYEPGKRQGMVFSLFGATAPNGFLVGAVFGSLIAEKLWWPWAYWLMCLGCMLCALVTWVVIPRTPAVEVDTSLTSSGGQKKRDSVWKRVDALGSAVGVAALVLFNFAWNQAPVVGWHVPYNYVTLILGVLLFGVFVLVEKRASHPLIPFGVLKAESLFALACIAAGWSSFGIFIVYTWNFLEVIRGQTPLLSAAQFGASGLSGLTAALTTGVVLGRIRASVVMLIAMVAFAAGGTILGTAPVHQTYWIQIFIGFVVLPWGMDMSFPAGTILLSRAMPKEHQGLAASLVNTLVNYSISIGLGIAGTVESQMNPDGTRVLFGYRSAFYVGIGLACMGICVALTFVFTELKSAKKAQSDEEHAAAP